MFWFLISLSFYVFRDGVVMKTAIGVFGDLDDTTLVLIGTKKNKINKVETARI